MASKPSTAGTGHAIVDKVLDSHQIARRVVLRVVLRLPSFLGVARIVAQTEFLVIEPRLLGMALASKERVQLLDPPVPLPSYPVKRHRHVRFNADTGSMWQRKTMVELFSNVAAQGPAQGSGRWVKAPPAVAALWYGFSFGKDLPLSPPNNG